MSRLIELLRDALTDSPLSRTAAWAELRATSLREREPRAGALKATATSDDLSLNSNFQLTEER